MELTLSHLSSPVRMKRRRVGRGNAGKGGTYAGKGLKGQRSRSGGKHKGRHGGKKFPPFIGQIPKKRGFKSLHSKFHIVNLDALEHHCKDGEHVTPAWLQKKGIISGRGQKVKILGFGVLTKKLNVSAHGFSSNAKHAIQKAGGTFVCLQSKKLANSGK